MFEETYIGVVAAIENERDIFHPATEIRHPTAPVPAGPQPALSTREVPLPDVKLPMFSGEYIEWLAFKEVFTSHIHNSRHLADYQRFQYLKGHVSGVTADDIKHISVTGDNFSVAWQVLTETYENDKRIFYHYMQIFDKQPAIQKDDPGALRSFIQTSRSCVTAMSKLDQTIADENRLLVFYVLKKLPVGIRAEFNHENRKLKTIPTFKDLCTMLEEHYQMMITSSSLANVTTPAPATAESRRRNDPSAKKEVNC